MNCANTFASVEPALHFWEKRNLSFQKLFCLELLHLCLWTKGECVYLSHTVFDSFFHLSVYLDICVLIFGCAGSSDVRGLSSSSDKLGAAL